MIRALAILVVIPSALCGQFEVASVKISRTPNGPSAMHIYSIPGRIVIQNRTLREILAEAYKLREFQVKGPDWLADVRLDITALKPPNATPEQTRAMLQQLLTERFKLSARLITRVIAAGLRDPADRAIVATARVHRLKLITSDQRIIASGLVPVIA